MEDDRPRAVQPTDDDEVEAGEDASPDWSKFAALTKSSRNTEDLTHAVPFIPKRGEKDFEPIPPSDFPLSGNEALLSQHQLNLLTDSRNALYTALSSGSRSHSSKNNNSFTWHPEIDGGRAVADGPTYGVHFGTIGTYSSERQQVELRVEEALLLVERGVIELWTETVPEGAAEKVRLPMSVQQAWSELIGHDELTLERFQIYCHLKRLGYTVVRARSPPSAVKPLKVAPLAPTPFLQSLLSTINPRHLLRILSSRLRALQLLLTPQRARLGLTRAVKAGEGIMSSLSSGRRWASYEQIFSRLQIIPSGFDKPLPRGPVPRSTNILEPLLPLPASAVVEKPELEQHPYQIFFHVYKPVTKFKKSAPPEPDFRLVVINAVTTPLPDLFEFVSMFESTPFPEEDTLLAPPRRTATPASGASAAAAPSTPSKPSTAKKPSPSTPSAPSTPAKASPSATSATTSTTTSSRPPRRPRQPPPPPPSKLKVFLSYLPFGPTLPPKRTFRPNHYPRLKMGRRSILVAIVENGTTSFLRFSEAEFGKLSWYGKGRAV